MADADYPALGFDPAPGNLEAVGAMTTALQKAVTALSQGDTLYKDLSNTNTQDWQGDAADAFRDSLKGDLDKALTNAHDSLQKAYSALDGWHQDLAGYQQQAKSLEVEAEAALKNANAANSTANSSAAVAPKPGTEGPFTADEQAKITQAQSDHTAAVNAVNAFNAVVSKAKTLQGTHDDAAKTVAKSLKDAPHNLAPHKPGLFASIGNWLSSGGWKDIGDVLGDISAVAGVVAIFTPPPIDAIALGVSVVSSGLALGAHLASGQASLFDIGADVAGMVPGIGVLGDAAKDADLVARTGEAVEGVKSATNVLDAADSINHGIDGVVDTARNLPGALNDATDAVHEGTKLSQTIMGSLNGLPGVTTDLAEYGKYLDAAAGGVLSVNGAAAVAGDFGAPLPEPWASLNDASNHRAVPYVGVANVLDQLAR